MQLFSFIFFRFYSTFFLLSFSLVIPLPSSRLLNVFRLMLNFLLSYSVRRMWKQETGTLKSVPAEFKGPKHKSLCSDWAVGWTKEESVVSDLRLPPRCTWCVQVLRSPKEAFAAAMQSWLERCEKLCMSTG